MLKLLAVCLCFVAAPCARALSVTMDTSAAKAVLLALQNANLSHEDALQIAGMYGNQGVVRKLQEFKIAASEAGFADALYDAAHGKTATDATARSYAFDRVRPMVAALLALIAQIEADPVGFQAAIERRIALFTPADAKIQLNGYIVAAGDGGGYAFGTTDFYLNLWIADELIIAKSIATHELYHAVQGAFAKDREPPQSWSVPCRDAASIFGSLYEEGSAVYVEDTTLLAQSHSPIAARKREDMSDGLRNIGYSVTLLEMSVAAFQAPVPLALDDVYAVGFYGHGELYNIGYVMAKAIAEDEGAPELTSFLKRPAYEFVLHYTQLPKYGVDKLHPKLGANTLAAADRMRNGCGSK